MMEYLRNNLKLKEGVEFISDDELYYENSKTPSFYVPNNVILTEEKMSQIKALGYKIQHSKTLQPNQIEVDFNSTVYSEFLGKINQQDTLVTEVRIKLKEKDSFLIF